MARRLRGRWRSYRHEAIEALFSADAEYRYDPWDEPVTGRSAIAAGWPETPDVVDRRVPVLGGHRDRGVAVGVTRHLGADGETVEREYHNVWLCRFDREGRCREFTELYMQR